MGDAGPDMKPLERGQLWLMRIRAGIAAAALLAAVAAAAGVEAEVAGKPYQPMADAVRDRLGGAADDGGLVVGDRPDTDGLIAKRLELDFALVFTGVTKEDDLPVDPEPVKTADDLPTLVDQELA